MSIIEGVTRDATTMFNAIYNSSSSSKDVKPISDREIQETLASETDKRIGSLLHGTKQDDSSDDDMTVTLGTATTMDEIGLKLAKADLKNGVGKLNSGIEKENQTLKRVAQANKDAEDMFNAIFDK